MYTDIDKAVDPQRLIDTMENVLKGEFTEAPRTSIRVAETWFGSMISGTERFISAKLVGVYPANPGRGLPMVRGRLLLFDTSSGEKLLDIPAEEPTGWRTAAATALALKHLGFTGGGTLGIIGAGVQARYHGLVLTSVFNIDRILVSSRTQSRAYNLASRLGGKAVDRATLLSSSTVVVATTNSTTPVVEGRLLAAGAFVASVGAPRPVRELDEDVKKRAGCIVVDSPIAEEESDDVSGVDKVLLKDLVRMSVKCRFGDIRVYKSVGTPVLDLAMAIYLYKDLYGEGSSKTP